MLIRAHLQQTLSLLGSLSLLLSLLGSLPPSFSLPWALSLFLSFSWGLPFFLTCALSQFLGSLSLSLVWYLCPSPIFGLSFTYDAHVLLRNTHGCSPGSMAVHASGPLPLTSCAAPFCKERLTNASRQEPVFVSLLMHVFKLNVLQGSFKVGMRVLCGLGPDYDV